MDQRVTIAISLNAMFLVLSSQRPWVALPRACGLVQLVKEGSGGKHSRGAVRLNLAVAELFSDNLVPTVLKRAFDDGADPRMHMLSHARQLVFIGQRNYSAGCRYNR